ncbi:MAG: recombination protein RmuC [Thermotogota bacterium]|nr:recombination protein RmuC [Thermotogota bacterium]
MAWILAVIVVILGLMLVYAKREARTLSKQLAESLEQLEGLKKDKDRLEKENVRFQEQLKSLQEKLEWLENAKQELERTFRAVAAEIASKNTETFFIQASDKLSGVVNPLRETLQSLQNNLQEIERKRESAYGSLQTLAQEILKTHSQLQKEVVGLKSALKSSSPRGKWGEYELRRIIELAGMTRYVSFFEQESSGEGRPDVLIRLPGGGVVPIDAKVPLEAYFEAIETDDPSTRKERLSRHVKSMRETIRQLSRKAYWNSFDKAPEFVVMFVPVEAAVRIAFEEDPGILEDAFDQKVLITTPVTLLALLKAVAFGWQQFLWNENAKKIAQEGRALYERAVKFLEHYNKIGKNLSDLVKAYNDSVGSLQSRLFPSLRRMTELSGEPAEPPSLSEVELYPRSLELPESEKE